MHLEDTLERAVERAATLAEPGDVILLSPGGTSFDAFADFEARGTRFRELVASLGSSSGCSGRAASSGREYLGSGPA